MPGMVGSYENWGNFKCHKWGELLRHSQLRHDPLMAVLAAKLEARREDCAPVAGKSTLNRLELSRERPTKYR